MLQSVFESNIAIKFFMVKNLHSDQCCLVWELPDLLAMTPKSRCITV